MKYMFDTNVFNYFIDNNIDVNYIQSKGELYTTNVQFSELSNNPYEEYRTKLLELYEALDMIKLQLESGLWLDNLRWDNSQVWHDTVGDGFNSMLGNSQGHYDAMIGEVVMNNDLILVTEDIGFRTRASNDINNVTVLSIEEFLNQ